MTTREKAHRLIDELPESEVEPVLEFIASRREDDEGHFAVRRAAPSPIGAGALDRRFERGGNRHRADRPAAGVGGAGPGHESAPRGA